MKRGIIFLVFLTLLFTCSCSSKEKNQRGSENRVEVKNIDMKSASSIIDNYMRYVVDDNKGAMKSFYSKKLKETLSENQINEGPSVVGYKVEEMENKEDKIEVTAHIYSEYKGKPYFSDDTYKYTLIMEGRNTLIDKIQKQQTVEIYEKNHILYKREGDSIQGNHILAIGDLPYFTNVMQGNSMEGKIYVPRKSFGPCAQSPDGNTIIISCSGNGSLIAALKMKEEKETFQPSKEGGSQEGEEGDGENEGGKKGEEQGKEKLNITFKPVDFYAKERINLITFSEDGKMFVVESRTNKDIGRIFIYKIEGNDITKQKMDNQFKDSAFSVVSPYFISKDELIFNVSPLGDATIEQKKFKGQWIIDLKTSKIKQIK